MKNIKSFVILSNIIFLIMGCNNKEQLKGVSSLNNNIAEYDLKNRDSLSKSLEFAEGIKPYKFNETFTLHGKHLTEKHKIELLSWGNVDMPDLIILLSNDQESKRSHIVRLEGKLARHWVKDLNRDGNPELILFSNSGGSGNYGSLIILEFDTTLSMKTYKLSDVDISENKQYMGHDNFEIHGDTIKRTFPKYLPNEPNCCPTGGYDSIEYVWEIENFFELMKHN